MTERRKGGGEPDHESKRRPEGRPDPNGERVDQFRGEGRPRKSDKRSSMRLRIRIHPAGGRPIEVTGVEKHIDTTFQESIVIIMNVLTQPDLAGLIRSDEQLIDAVIEINRHPEIADAIRRLVELGMTKDDIRDILKNKTIQLYEREGDEAEITFASVAGRRLADIVIEFAEDMGVFGEPSIDDED